MNPIQSILFVCIENSCRSQMAEAFARIHGGNRVKAFSAGSKPSGVVNATAISTMSELGYDLTSHASKSIDDLPAQHFDWIVTMGCGDACPNLPARHREDWAIPDPKNLPIGEFRSVRDVIGESVRSLLARLGEEART